MDHSKYSYEPVISCLGAVTFFWVSRLTHRRPERQCNPARHPKPRKKASRSCGRARMATVHRIFMDHKRLLLK
ncbi:MAG: hypothetical protein C4B57_07605 [Deltaproteobacteria bacterium]|nr:MAG: hypothetical protein C4B57_07605 [Deltaproteobacteria bacterium]